MARVCCSFACDHQYLTCLVVVDSTRAVFAWMSGFCRCLIGSAYEESFLSAQYLPSNFACECCVRGNPTWRRMHVPELQLCPSTLKPSVLYTSTDSRSGLQNSTLSNYTVRYSHDATVLGPKPSMALIRASIWWTRRQRTSSSVTSSKISLPGSSPSGPRCGRDVKP